MIPNMKWVVSISSKLGPNSKFFWSLSSSFRESHSGKTLSQVILAWIDWITQNNFLALLLEPYRKPVQNFRTIKSLFPTTGNFTLKTKLTKLHEISPYCDWYVPYWNPVQNFRSVASLEVPLKQRHCHTHCITMTIGINI